MPPPGEGHAHRRALREGAVAVSPVLLGVVPFGIVAGFAAIEAGLRLPEAVGFSTIVFAGAAQLAAIELLGRDAPVAVAVGAALVINLRFLMYSASLAPLLSSEPLARRAAGAYVLTDQAYAVSVVRFAADPAYPGRWGYYLGAALTMWIGWQASTVAGAFAGGAVPETVPLGFAVPITFLALLAPTTTDRATLVAAGVSGATAVAAAGLPANLGLLVAAFSGIGAGTALALAGGRR